MKIIVNGTDHVAPEGTSLLAFLSELPYSKENSGVAVALESTVIPKNEWDKTILKDGMKIEIVHAVAGG